MAIGNVLGRAYIEVHADSRPFANELGVEIEAIAKAAEPKSKSAGDKVAGDVVEGAKKKLEKEGKKIFSDFLGLFSGNQSGGRKGSFDRLGSEAGKAFTNGLQSALKGAGGIIPSIGSSIGNVGSNGPFAWIVGLGVVTLIPAIIALVSQLAALVNVVYLLPGAFSAAVAGIVPLIVAFHGFGTAISAIMSGDPKQIAEALKNLTPAARSVAKEFQQMLPLFHELRVTAQEYFFKPLIGALTVVRKALGPTLVAGFRQLALDGGFFTNQLLRLFASPQGRRFIAVMFDLADSFERELAPAVLTIVNGLMSLSTASAPFLKDLFARIGSSLTTFGSWLDTISKNGQLDKFLDNFNRALEKLKVFASAGWNLIQSLLGSTDRQNAADTFFDNLIDVITTLADFFASDEGHMAMQQLITDAGIFLYVLRDILTSVLLVFTAIQWAVDKLKELKALLGQDVTQGAIHVFSSTPAKTGTRDRGYAAGTPATDGPAWRWTGEAGPEAIIPLTDPARAKQLMDQSGLSQMQDGGDTNVAVYIGNEQLDARVVKVQSKGFKAFGRGMKYGPRLAAVGG
jgi:hypothetical protein